MTTSTTLSDGQSGFFLAQLDTALTVRQADREFLRKFGDSSAGVFGRSFCDLVHPRAQHPLHRRLSRLLQGGRHHFATRITMGPGDGTFTGRLTATATHDGTGTVTAVMVVLCADHYEVDGETHGDADRATSGGWTSERRFLTKVDAQILEGIAEGVPTVPLAGRVHLSRQGVEYHVTRLLRALHAPNRAALVSRAYVQGVLQAGAWPPKVDPELIG